MREHPMNISANGEDQRLVAITRKVNPAPVIVPPIVTLDAAQHDDDECGCERLDDGECGCLEDRIARGEITP
jgi:hypothetical protein